MNLYDQLIFQLIFQLREAKESFSVARDNASGSVTVELYLSSESPKPFWRFDENNNLVETNQ